MTHRPLGRRGMLAVTAAAAAAALLLPGACARTSQSPAAPSQALPRRDAVVVGSFNFDESRLLGEIYAQALERAGVPVRRELDLGPRELVQPALLQGLVDVVPEYAGSALTTVDPSANVTSDTAAVRGALADRLMPLGLQVLDAASAQNQNGFAVTRQTASRLGIRSLSDLAAVTPRLTLAGPPECPARRYCGAGLEDIYGITFSRFDAFITEQERVAALEQGVVDVAVVFTTDAPLARNDLVLLTDDRHLQPAENVVPVVSRRALAEYGPTITAALDHVSAQLSSGGLRFLNWRVTVAGKRVADEARGWLDRHGP